MGIPDRHFFDHGESTCVAPHGREIPTVRTVDAIPWVGGTLERRP